MRDVGGTRVTGEHRNTRRNPYPSVTFSTIYHMWAMAGPLKHEMDILKDIARTAQSTYSFWGIKISRLMVYWAIIAVFSENHLKHRNTRALYGQNVQFS